MRTIRSSPSIALAALLTLAGCGSTVPLPDAAEPQDVVVARFLLDVDGLEADFPDQGGGLIPIGTRVVQTGRDVGEAVNTALHLEGSAVKAAQDTVFAAFAEAVAARSSLRLLPLETLQGEVPYLIGAPMGRAKDVGGRSAIEIDVSVEVPDAAQGSWSFLGSGRATVSGHPEMTVAVRMLDADGRVAWQDRVLVRSRERVSLDERWLLGVRTERAVSDASTLPALITEAAEKLLRRHRSA